ncbi:GNAT family N-acetyltransferase [Thalassotalea litorea]|uniref:GNAT family N-acetyltransferase n=1 Tax=Thalassotalea litorea TaxID=2020715 RepID=UPI0037350705
MLSAIELQDRLNQCNWQTECLHIRNFQADDLAVELTHNKDPRIMRYIADIEDDATLEKKVREFMEPWQCDEKTWLGLAVCLRDEQTFIGIVCLRVDSLEYGRVEIGYRLHPDYHGKGYALEAAKKLVDWLFLEAQANKILAYCVTENHPSFGLMEKLGMQKEACLRQHSTLNGRWHDEFIYGLLKTEWQSQSS